VEAPTAVQEEDEEVGRETVGGGHRERRQRWWNMQRAEATPGIAVQVLLGEAVAATGMVESGGSVGGAERVLLLFKRHRSHKLCQQSLS
jgi:hypothetical protein